jgi:hypothetical protein
MQIVDTTRLDWELVVPNPRGGDVYRKVIRHAEGGRQVSYDVRFEKFGGGDRAYTSIRHRHDFEQLRFVASGRMDLGFAAMEEGDVAYFPANAFYGPQRCEDSLVLVAQWGDRFIAKADHDRALSELSARGEFRDGVYHGVDGEGRPFNKDPLNAIWEHVFGETYVPQTPRYRQPVVMTPEAFGSVETEGPVGRRPLGSFTEHGFAIESVRWEDDGILHVDGGENDRRPTLLFTTAGHFTCEDVEFGLHTAVWGDSGEGLKIEGAAGSELLLLRFPEPSSRLTVGARR